MKQALVAACLSRAAASRLACATALLLGGFAAPAHAMMLGQPEGTPLLGRVLHLRIPVHMDPGLPLAVECVRVRMRDGDSPVAPEALRVTVRDARAATSYIEVRTADPVRAPFVQLAVSMRCQFGLSRRYTLLAEPPSSAAADVDEAQIAEPRRTRASSRLVSKPRHADARHAERANAGTAPLLRHRAAAHVAPAPVHKATRAAPGSRLHMQWLAAALQPAHASAASSAAAVSTPAGAKPPPARAGSSRAEPPRADAASAAAQWALIEQRQAQLIQRVDALQERLAAEQQRDAVREREIAGLHEQLAHARLRTPRWWNAALGGLAGLCVLLGLMVWQRRDRSAQGLWYAAAPQPQAATREAAPLPSLFGADAPPTFPPASLPARSSGFSASAFQRPLSAPEQVQIDEVVDQGHLADFFIGLGDYDKAIDIMRRELAEAGGAVSALPYLYLFDLYRRSGRRADYEQLLHDCGSRLNVRIPAWDEEPEQAPRDLLDYPRALALLTASWGTPACLTVIERMIADDPLKPRVGFDLPAYRDLLELYALARGLQREPAEAGQAADLDAAAGALDLELALRDDAAHGGTEPARREWASSSDDETPTLQPLEWSISTQPPSTQAS